MIIFSLFQGERHQKGVPNEYNDEQPLNNFKFVDYHQQLCQFFRLHLQGS